jgi:ABC-type cobalamin/Fe3+-siderophores transport system ATPase subunit
VSSLFTLDGVGMRYNGTLVLQGITAELSQPSLVAITGPNGAGKSTLLAVMAGLRAPSVGACAFAGRDVRHWPRREFARKVAFVPQSVRIDFPFTVEQVVLMGRTPYCDGLFESAADREAVERAMAFTDIVALRHRDFRSLSGGERQRAVLASVLAQSPQALLLDEPTTFLDLQHQVSTYRLLRNLAADGLLVVAVTHDLNLAAAYSDRVLVLRSGELVRDAVASEALSPSAVREVFGVAAEMHRTAEGKPWISYGD